MSGFGNYLGAALGGSYDESFVTNSYYPERHALLENGDLDNPELVDLSADTHETAPDAYQPESDLLGEVPGLLSDDSVHSQVGDALSGGEALNWEGETFVALREEKNALKPEAIETLATAWKAHGDDLKTESEDFKESARNAISGKWSGASAAAAEAATQQVTKTSIYDFTPSSEAISNRLTALKGAFDHIKTNFPTTENAELIDEGEFDKAKLEQRVNEFNSKYHLDDSGRLRNNSDGYVSAQDAINEMNKINRSIEAYQDAVHLFNNTYNPTVQAVTENFPNLPPAPNMEYGKPPGDPGSGDPGTGGPGTGGPGTGGPGTGGPGTGVPNFGAPPVGTPAFPAADNGKNPAFADYQLGTGDDPTSNGPATTPITTAPITSPQVSPAQGLKPAMDAATKGMNSGIDAATKAAQQAAQGAAAAGKNAVPSLREGALGLGDKPGASKGGVGGRPAVGGGAGGSGGLGAHEPAARLSSQPTTSASGARAAVPAASSSAMSPMGAPGMGGAPAAGQRGGDGKEHKGNKALRTRKNGSDIVGDTDAVVPVLGGESPPPAEDSGQPAPPPRRRIPQRGNTWQPESAVQGGPPSPQTQHSGSAGSD